MQASLIMQEMEERVSGVEDMIEEIDISAKINVKSKMFLTQNTQKHYEKTKLK